MTRSRYILITCTISLVVAAVVFVIVDAPNPIDDAYAQWGAVDLVVGYMENHDGRWPPNWEALRTGFEKNRGRVGGSFEEFQRRIVIDFEADAEDLRKQSIASDHPIFNVVGARSLLAATMGDGPNAHLHSYFRRKSGIIEAPKPSGGWPSPKHRQLADEFYRRGFTVSFNGDGDIVAAWTSLVSGLRVDDQDLAELKHHPKLERLNLVDVHVTDAGLEVVQHLPNLYELVLSDTITDAGLKHLSGHPRLTSLDLFGTQISDIGLQRLGELPKLSDLRIDTRRISLEAVEKLKKAMPKLVIRTEGVLRM